MPFETSLRAHTSHAFEDLSGISTSAFENPYDALLSVCHDNVMQIQERYTLHRATRNSQQKRKLLDESFPGVNIDPILLRLFDPTVEPSYVDPRHCLVFWARPTLKIKDLINRVQQELLSVAPNLWLMPQDCLHMTALEVTHSKKAEEVQQLVETMRDKAPSICDYTFAHRARLIKPMIGYDASALALSFVPAAGEGFHDGRSPESDQFTYHHLRRDLFNLCAETGISMESRYVVPSSHLTIGRFINPKDFQNATASPDPQKMGTLIQKIEGINEWLMKEYWPEYNSGKIPDGGEWIIGEEKGLNFRMGTLWYGGGESIHVGKGF